MDSIPELIDALGGPSALSRIIGVKVSTAGMMKQRGIIPVKHWPAIIAAASDRRIRVNEITLLRLHTNRSGGVRLYGIATTARSR